MGPRAAGILLHPTSLPGHHGIGELGSEATAFLDFLAETGQVLWQVLPLGPTGYGDSPYQCFSAFAGNPLLVSLDRLLEGGLLAASDLRKGPGFPEREVDFGPVIEFKRPLLAKAFAAFEKKAVPKHREALESFTSLHAAWLHDFTLFMALKRANGGAAWSSWDRSLVNRDAEALERARRELGREVQEVAFEQWLFFEQWAEVRRQARERGIRILGDIPIFVAQDSADVWAHPEIFHLDADGRPSLQAGVPPDYFSATGQLWGNPLYRWDALGPHGLRLVDRPIPGRAGTRGHRPARSLPRLRGLLGGAGRRRDRRRGPVGEGSRSGVLRRARRRALGELPIVAEDLGVITPEVEALRDRFGFPGMAILQFAFGTDAQRQRLPAPQLPARTRSSTPAPTTTTPSWAGGGRGGGLDPHGGGSREGARARARLLWRRRERDPLGLHKDPPRLGGRHGHRPASGRAGGGGRGPHEPARSTRRQLAVALRRVRPQPGPPPGGSAPSPKAPAAAFPPGRLSSSSRSPSEWQPPLRDSASSSRGTPTGRVPKDRPGLRIVRAPATCAWLVVTRGTPTGRIRGSAPTADPSSPRLERCPSG